MEVVGPLLEQAGFGFMAGIFLWLFLKERNDHAETRKRELALMEARRVDSVDSKDQMAEVVQGTSQSLELIGAKIEAVQNYKGKKR